jgi:hypothetical protein
MAGFVPPTYICTQFLLSGTRFSNFIFLRLISLQQPSSKGLFELQKLIPCGKSKLGRHKCQGMTSVMPYPPNRERALAPEKLARALHFSLAN